MKPITENKKKLTIQQLRHAVILTELATGKSVSQVAHEYGRNRKWLSGQINHPRNQELFRDIYESTLAIAQNRLPALVQRAFDEIEKELQHPYDHDRRLAAAKAVLSIAGRHWQSHRTEANPDQ